MRQDYFAASHLLRSVCGCHFPCRPPSSHGRSTFNSGSRSSNVGFLVISFSSTPESGSGPGSALTVSYDPNQSFGRIRNGAPVDCLNFDQEGFGIIAVNRGCFSNLNANLGIRCQRKPASSRSARTFAAGTPRLEPPNSGSIAVFGVAPVSWTVMDLGERGVAGSFRS